MKHYHRNTLAFNYTPNTQTHTHIQNHLHRVGEHNPAKLFSPCLYYPNRVCNFLKNCFFSKISLFFILINKKSIFKSMKSEKKQCFVRSIKYKSLDLWWEGIGNSIRPNEQSNVSFLFPYIGIFHWSFCFHRNVCLICFGADNIQKI